MLHRVASLTDYPELIKVLEQVCPEQISTHVPVEKKELIILVVAVFRREWFEISRLGTKSIGFALLLFCLYLEYLESRLVGKIRATQLVGVEHLSTASAYIKRAIDLGLIVEYQYPRDRRVELLIPTDKLFKIVNRELELFRASIRKPDTR